MTNSLNNDLVSLDIQGGIATLTLNSPKTLNALSQDMILAILDALKRIANDHNCRVVVLASQGKAFCAGHDLKEMAAFSTDQTQYKDLFNVCSKMMLAIQQLPQPVIARVHGIATAAGCQLVGACDLAIAAQSARFATSGINYGLFCATPSVALLRNVPRKHAMHMLLTGDFITADQAYEWGLINQVVEDSELDASINALCQSIAAKPYSAIALGKQLVYQQAHLNEAAAYQIAAQTMACNAVYPSARQGVEAFVQKQVPQFNSPSTTP